LGTGGMVQIALEVLYEDNHLLAVAKPAGLATMGVPKGKPTLLAAAKEYLKRRYQKPGKVFLGVVSRLDGPVTGVVLLARTSKAARRLSEQFRSLAVEKTYWAIVEGRVEPARGECVDWIGQDKRHRRMWIVGPTVLGAKQARLAYRRLNVLRHGTLLEVQPATGRKHQIRLQLAHRGYPILGDRKYGGRGGWPAGIALHSRRLVVTHPTKGIPLELEAPLPTAWREIGVGN